MRVINAEERQLVVTDEQLRSVRDVGDELQRALYLNVSFNGLETLAGIEQARSLRNLNVSHNALTSLHDAAALSQLRVLKCSHNQIADLSWASALVGLEELWINENRVESSELSHLQPLVGLKWLVLQPNPCTANNDYAVAVVKLLPWLERIDAIAVDKELRDKAEGMGEVHEERLGEKTDDLKPTLVVSAKHPNEEFEPSPSKPPPPKPKKKLTAEDFMRNFPVQDFIPVANQLTPPNSDGVVSSSLSTGSASEQPISEGAAPAPVESSPSKVSEDSKQKSPTKVSPSALIKNHPKALPATSEDGSNGVSSILGAVLSLPTFGADDFLKKQTVSKPQIPKKTKTVKTDTITSDDNSEAFQPQEPLMIPYPNSTVTAVQIRADGSAVAKWPSGSIAVSVDKEPGGFRIYAAHKDGTIALSFDPLGVGFINYYPSGRMFISTSSNGDGLCFSSDGFTILRQWDANGNIRDDKFEATDALGDEHDGSLFCKLSDNLAVNVRLLPRQAQSQKNPIALRIFFSSSTGIRRVFVNRPNVVDATECKKECEAVFGKEVDKAASKPSTVTPPPIPNSDLLGEIRAAVAGL